MKLQNTQKARKGYEELENRFGANSLAMRFIQQWMGTIEMELADAPEKELQDVVRSTMFATRERLNFSQVNFADLAKALENVWIYGKEFKEWFDDGGMKNHKKEEVQALGREKEVYFSFHARKRVRTRLGLNSKACNTIAKKAYHNGICIENTTGVIHSYMARVLQNTKDNDRAEIRIHNNSIYVYKEEEKNIVLITVFPVPQIYQKNMKNEIKNGTRRKTHQNLMRKSTY